MLGEQINARSRLYLWALCPLYPILCKLIETALMFQLTYTRMDASRFIKDVPELWVQVPFCNTTTFDINALLANSHNLSNI